MTALRLLAIAAGSRHMAYVFFTGERLIDWKISDRARNGSEDAVRSVRTWIADLGPTAVVSERPDTAARKGAKAKALIAAIGDEARSANIVHVAVTRPHDFPNKYAEAAFFAARYPDLAPWLPEKRIGPVTYFCRSDCSFRPLGVRRPRGFCLPMLSADGAGYRSR